MATEFTLLGDVDVRIDGQPIDVGPARQRCVLIALLVDANKVVSVDQLLERVWAQRRPRRARDTLYSYVCRLRQCLAATDAAVIRRSGGYVLTVDPMAVDLNRFRRLVTQAHAASDGDDLSLLEQALQLWSGDAFAHLVTPWLDDLRRTLGRERLAAELDRNDIALRRSHHAEVLSAVSALATAYPLDERLAAQLMLALYRCGRQVDALEHYRQTRRMLTEELGIDPGSALQKLHQRILTTDPALTLADGHTVAAKVTPPPVPQQLPSPPAYFTGRGRELAQLTAALDGQANHGRAIVVSAIGGAGGIGKTWLALRWAHDNLGRFPDGQLYVNLRGFDPSGQPTPPTTVIRAFLDALGVQPAAIPADLDAQAGLYRSLIAGKHMLVVLDNARDTAQVAPLLPGTPTCTVLVTSRQQLAGLIAAHGARPLTLDVLTTAEARELLTRRIGTARAAAEPQALDDVVASCARLPLALAVVAARAATYPEFSLATLASELNNARSSLDAFTDTDATIDVRSALSWSYRTLSPQAARMFRLLGLHPGPDISMAAMASLAGVPPRQAQAQLAELSRANLITEHVAGRYAFHDLLRAYTGELARAHDPEPQRRAALHRVLDHYVHTAHAANRLRDPHRPAIRLSPVQPGVTPEDIADQTRALAWFTTERIVLMAALDQAAADQFDTHAYQLAWALIGFVDQRGQWPDWVATQHTALHAARRLDDRAGQAEAHRGLARAHTRLGHHDDAHVHYLQALHFYGELDDPVGQAQTHLGIGWLLDQRGRYQDAFTHTQRALDLFRTAGNRAGEGRALNAVGWSYTRLGDYQQALAHCRRALTVLEELGDRVGEAATWDSLAHSHHRFGHHVQAATCYQHAIDLYRNLGDRHWEAQTLINLGDAQHAAGQPHAARTAWENALAILDELNYSSAEDVRTKLRDLDSPTPAVR